MAETAASRVSARPDANPTADGPPRRWAVLAIAAIISVAFAGSVVVTPLYPLYQAKFGFSEITLTLVYAAYTIGNLAALLLLGQVSDQVGRKRVVLPALALAALSALLFLAAAGTAWLYAGRVLIGLAVGVASGSGTAWLAEEFGPDRRATATLAAATANLIGIALGPAVGGLLGEYTSAPLRAPFVVYIAAVLIVAVGVGRTRERGIGNVRSWRQVRVHPRLGVPRRLLASFTAPAITGFVTFALGGLYFALIPGIVRRELHETNVAVGGLIVFELGLCAAACILLARRLRAAVAMSAGLLLLLPAVGLVVVAEAARSMPLLLGAAALAGVTMALGYRGSLQVVNDIAPDDRRAEVVSTYFIACFVGNSVPVIGVGVLSTWISPLSADGTFAAVVGALAIAALIWRWRTAGRDTDRGRVS